LESCKVGIVIWSRASVRSEYVKAEANRLRERKCLVPVYIEDCKPPVVFGLIQGIKCREPRTLANDELANLYMAINKNLTSSTDILDRSHETGNSRKTTWPLVARLQFRDLSLGIFLGILLCYFFLYWYHLVPQADVQEFNKLAGTIPPKDSPLTLDSKFPESADSIAFARMRIRHNSGWPAIIVNQWAQHYEAQRRFVQKYCQDMNNAKALFSQTMESKRTDYLKQGSLKTSQELTKLNTVWASSSDRGIDLLRFLKHSRCPGDEGHSLLVFAIQAFVPD
jgi:hypothetical protein